MSDAPRGNVVVIAGPSGSGKNSIINGVIERCSNCVRLVTATTREPRAGEVDGVDYHFLSKGDFLAGMKDGRIPEHWYAEETDRYYGTYLPDLEQKLSEGKTVLAHMQIEGARYFKAHFNALTLFIMPHSLDVLRQRVLERQDMGAEELEERLAEAQREIQEDAPQYDMQIVNEQGKLDEAIQAAINLLRDKGFNV